MGAVKKPALSSELKKRFSTIFFQNVVGIFEEAGKNKIRNNSVIFFGGGETKSSFRAYADTPLVIINNMPGYKIIFNLVDFSYDNATEQNNLFFWVRPIGGIGVR